MIAAGDDASDARPVGYELLVTIGILLALLMGALDNFVALTALPTILGQFHQLNSGTFVISAYVIASTTGIPIFAKLSDLWSRRNVFLGGLAIFIAGSLLSGVSQNLNELILFRAVQGFGSGGFFPVGIAIVAVVFPPETRARVVGLLSGVFGIAVVAGPLIGDAIVTYTTWRWVFYVNIPFGILGFVIIAIVLGPLRPALVRRFDLIGAALLAAWVGAVMFPLYQIADAGWAWTDPRVLGLLGLGAVLIVTFVVWELRQKNPLVPLRLLAHRVMSAGGGATFFIGMVFFPVATFLSLVVGVALSPGNPNTVRDILYFLVIPLVFGAVVGGQLLTRVSYRVVAVSGVLIGIVGMAGLTNLTTSTPLWIFRFGLPVGGVVLPLIPLGFGIGMTFPVFLLAAQNLVGSDDVGEAGGLIQFLQSLGGAVGLSVLASFQATRLAANLRSPGPSSFPAALINSYDQTFAVMVGLLVVALVFVVFLTGRIPRSSPTARSNLPTRDADSNEPSSSPVLPPEA
jgi:EmrB/QacA subfamily drug resistance transporter